MGWSKKYKRSIDCNNPKGFSQKAHCAGRKKQESKMSLKLEELVGKKLTEEQFDEAAGKKDACYHKVKARYDVWPSAYASGALVKCRKVGAKNWGNKSKKEGIEEKMRPAIKKALAQKGYGPIFNAIETSKRQLKQLRYSRGEIQDTLIDMFGDEDPKILKKIKEGVNILGVKKINEGKFRVHFDLDPDASPAQRLGLMSVEVTAKDKKEAEKMVASKFVGGMKLIRKNMTKKLKEGVNEAGVEDRMLTIMKRMTKKYKTVKGLYTSKQKGGQMYFGFGDKAEAKDLEKELKKHLNKVKYQYEKSNDRHVVLALLPGLVDHVDKKQDVFVESITKDGMTETHVYWESNGKPHGYTFNFVNELNEAEYQGRKVKLGKVMQGDTKKFKVYVKNPKGNVVKVNFGQGGDAKGGTMRIRKSNPAARKSFRARHNCDNPGPRHKARYWSCKKW